MEPMKMQVFLDGICDIYRIADSGLPEKIYDGIPLSEPIVGSRRAFDAMQAGHTIQRVIRIPVVPADLNGCYVTIGPSEYSVLQAQRLKDTSPQCLQLTLELPNIRWAMGKEAQ